MEKRLNKILMWGTYGKGGIEHCVGTCPKHQLRVKPLNRCNTEHLQMILKNQRHVYNFPHYVEAIHSILKNRGVRPAKFSSQAEYEMNRAVNRAVVRIATNG